ncbi:type II toxin-antitoxin system HipA family toxin [Neorhizobium galegae]|uniref:type II toxin-antitoxin system HipA family toxin n=1 Tax=Neorhizobium galegae TaxID=399 RepID=UPI000622AED2|nr:type II toxin-antitoxin system HipA family toxin [Neorhizobium galegae]CDZ56654.1 HipA N-terminal domain protein [Neorhizobium galegae bv. orientalis]KAB1122728.1 type II toxin-antitoxin system HipA family toxin [Neorhizobium galegae]MCQ1807831.1 type II toxin-antitoxin system HipA family toxin [Neorhizobium galegae]MCQ1838401.1 type II toxin-antitoxin system HipA family toxin [Neorhizobium galegae]UIY31875.1 type II toxin-antitoxin system HipA family toxin [Neorhizobium galegae]
MSNTLSVFLRSGKADTQVATLIRERSGLMRFIVEGAYIALGENRPILSSSIRFIGDEERTVRMLTSGPITQPGRDLHPWFSNLLPEGALRDLVLWGLPTGATTDFDVLTHLGHDLPGAVMVRVQDEPAVAPPEREPLSNDQADAPNQIRFSLAGVQLKMSMLKQDERLTFPATGMNGDIIAKLPSERYAMLPELEYSSMKLAEAAGVTIPHCELVQTGSVVGIKPEMLKGDYVLAVKRLDRAADGARVHMEDFCQVMQAPKERKYTAANEETVMNLAKRFGRGTKDYLEIVRRTTVNILLGNGDAHLKNHSLIYEDGINGALSPAYDIVATIVYDGSNELALKFRDSHDSLIVGLARFQRAADLAGVPANVVKKEVTRTVEKAADTWGKMMEDLPLSGEHARIIMDRVKTLRLSADTKVAF